MRRNSANVGRILILQTGNEDIGQQRRRQVASPTGGDAPARHHRDIRVGHIRRQAFGFVWATTSGRHRRRHKTACGHVTEEMRQRYDHELPVVQPPHKPHVLERGTT